MSRRYASKLSVVLTKERFLPGELVWDEWSVRLCGKIIVSNHSPAWLTPYASRTWSSFTPTFPADFIPPRIPADAPRSTIHHHNSFPPAPGENAARNDPLYQSSRWQVENNKLSPLGGWLSVSVFPRSDSGRTRFYRRCFVSLIANFESLSSSMTRFYLANESLTRNDELSRTLESGNYSMQLIARGEKARRGFDDLGFRLFRDSKMSRG